MGKKKLSEENGRQIILQLAETFGIKNPKQWGEITIKQIEEQNCSKIIKKYGNSIYWTLKSLFPETSWDKNWFVRSHSKSLGFWKNKQNQRSFLDDFANKHKISSPELWGTVTVRDIHKAGGGPLLTHYHNNSLFQLLSSVYLDIPWNKHWFTAMKKKEKGFWQSKENQRKFLLEVARKNKVLRPQDWGKITQQVIIQEGGSSLLVKYKSIRKALVALFEDTKWEKEWFLNVPIHPHGHWTDPKIRRNFLDKLAQKFEIKSPKDWSKITAKVIIVNGGGGLIYKYGMSVYKTLSQVYPDQNWNPEWFKSFFRKYPVGYWENINNQRKFIDEISNQYHITSPSQWHKVSIGLLNKKGGRGLLRKYGNSVLNMLSSIYPSINWGKLGEIKEEMQASQPQTIVFKLSKIWFPLDQIRLNYKHPDIRKFSSHQTTELDIWIPKYKLAFEYNGPHHYRVFFNAKITDQIARDRDRRDMCKQLNITLIEVPYWWDEKEESLLATLVSVRPDLMAIIRSPLLQDPIFLEKLQKSETKIPVSLKYKDAANWWNPTIDPTNWIMSEKYDGIRAYWDGKNLYHRSGEQMSCPHWFRDFLPKGISVEGELWAGRSTFTKALKGINLGDWSSLTLMLFDAPSHPGNFEERLKFLRNLFPNDSKSIKVIDWKFVKGTEHLLRSMQEIIDEGGEGIVIQHRESNYVLGRSPHLLKVKPFFVEFAEVIELEQLDVQLDGKTKFNYVTVKNIFGNQFRLSTRVSGMKFPSLFKGCIVTIGFSGLHTHEIPKFPILLKTHENSSLGEIFTYFVDKSNYRNNYCSGCGSLISDLGVHVKGIKFPFKPLQSVGREPQYRLFSFCLDKQCIEEGLRKLNEMEVKLPKWENKVGLKLSVESNKLKKMEGIQTITGENNLIEDYFIFRK